MKTTKEQRDAEEGAIKEMLSAGARSMAEIYRTLKYNPTQTQSALQRLSRKGEARSENGKWFLVVDRSVLNGFWSKSGNKLYLRSKELV